MAIGIVAEFNPFHNGHKYLIANAKKHNEKIIAVMSGSWVQRGEPSITDKWSRARAALENGVDLVIELPVVFSLNTAQSFAMGAVSTLAATGAVTTLTFGSECGSSETLLSAAEKLLNESDAVSLKIKQSISSGMSYAAARCAAYNTILPQGLLSSPNDILALEYIQAINKLKLNFDVHAIKRYGVPHDGNISQNIASASKIRQIITHGGRAEEYMPNSDFAVYDKSALDSAVIAKLRTVGADYLKTINDVNEGLENRFIKAAALSETVDELCMNVKSKRYTLSRIRRIAYSALLGITKKQYKPSYIRVLGMNERGKEILKQMKTTAVLPVIIKAADYRGDEIFSLNSRAEDIFALCAPTREQKRGGRDITQSPVVL